MRRFNIERPEDASGDPPPPIKIVSWNLLHLMGASMHDVVGLIRQEQPDLLLMQEATPMLDSLTTEVGGFYARTLQPGRRHGLATWSRNEPVDPIVVIPLPPGAMFDRICQISYLRDFAVANVHLSHGQFLNRRQLRHIVQSLTPRAAVLGDFNLVGPALLPGFSDVGPRTHTHMSGGVMPLRIDRCLVRGLACTEARTLLRGASDHRPITVQLEVAAVHRGSLLGRRLAGDSRRAAFLRAVSRRRSLAKS